MTRMVQKSRKSKMSSRYSWYPFDMKLFFACAILIFVMGCETTQSNQSEMIQRPFSEVDANQSIVLNTGKTFEIELPENPTTGYAWKMEVSNASIVKEISHSYTAHKSGRLGAAGEGLWTFRTLSVGSADITASYERPWDDNDEPTKVITFTLQVQ